MGSRGGAVFKAWDVPRIRETSSATSGRTWFAADVRRCLGVDRQPLRCLPGIHPCPGSNRRIQRQVHVQSVCVAWRIVRYARKPHPRQLSQLLSSPCALAVHGHKARQMILHEAVPLPPYIDEVMLGLTSRPKTLPCKLFYDDRGSQLFEEITRLPEYYPTRTEFGILQDSAKEIVSAAGTPVSIVELGAGTATKTSALLRAFARRQLRVKYYPVDISASALGDAKDRIKAECQNVTVLPVVADFSHGFHFLREIPGRKLVLYLGSSIGNFEWNDAIAMLRKVREQLTPGDALLLGTDMVKPPEILVPAYDDAQGVTAQFNKNILVRLNRELDANFDVDSFRHIAEWAPTR